MVSSCSHEKKERESKTDDTLNTRLRGWSDQSKDSLLWRINSVLFDKYLPVLGEPPIPVPDSVVRMEATKGAFNKLNVVEILTDSIFKQFGLETGMPPSSFVERLGYPDLRATERKHISTLTYILYGEWGSCIKYVFYFKSDRFLKTIYYWGGPC